MIIMIIIYIMLTWGAFLYEVLRKVLHLTILFLGRQMTHGARLPPGLSAAVWVWGGVQMGKNV